MRIVKLGKANTMRGKCSFCETEFEFFKSEAHADFNPDNPMELIYSLHCPACGKVHSFTDEQPQKD